MTKHTWVLLTPEELKIKRRMRKDLYDYLRCTACGVTGRRQRGEAYVACLKPYNSSKAFRLCRGPAAQ